MRGSPSQRSSARSASRASVSRAARAPSLPVRRPESQHERIRNRDTSRVHAQIGEGRSLRFGQPLDGHRQTREDARVWIVGRCVREIREIRLAERIEQVVPGSAASHHRAAHRARERKSGAPLRDVVRRGRERLHARAGRVRELPERRVRSQCVEEELARAQAPRETRVAGGHQHPATGAELGSGSARPPRARSRRRSPRAPPVRRPPWCRRLPEASRRRPP